MKKWLLISATALFLMAGCVNQQFVGAVDAVWQVVGPEYIEYVQSDPNLDADSKVTRQRTAKLLGELIEEAKKQYE